MNILLKLKNRMCYEYLLLKYILKRYIYKPPHVLNTLKSIQYIQEHNCSICRFGDGEMELISSRDLAFQKYNTELAKKLHYISSLSQQETQELNILICIPDIFKKIQLNNDNKGYWIGHLAKFRQNWQNIINKKTIYGNAFISRFYSVHYDLEYSKKIYNALTKLWENRDIVFIEGEFSRLGIGNDCFDNANSVKRIIAPAKNSFDKYDELIEFALTMPKGSLFILALGPTATVMAYDLAQKGYQALDLGHIDLEYEWYKIKAKSKVTIQGKYCNETFLSGNQNAEVIGKLPKDELDKYYSQIIYKYNECNTSHISPV